MNKMDILEKLAQNQPAKLLKDILKERRLIAKAEQIGKMSAPVDYTTVFETAKATEAGKAAGAPKADWFTQAKEKAIPWIATAGGLMLLYGAVDQIVDYLQQKGKAVKSKEYFQTMLKAHPQLQKEDPKVVAQYWESLYHFAPEMAEDPLASGAWITQSIRKLSGQELGGPSPDSYAALAQINKNLKDSTKDSSISSQEFILPELSKGLMHLGG